MKNIEGIIGNGKIDYRKMKNRLVIKNPKNQNIHERIFSLLEDEGIDMTNWIYYYSEKGHLVLQKHPKLM